MAISTILIKTGTRAEIEAAKLAGELNAREHYFISDEGRVAIGTGNSSYVDLALERPRLHSTASTSSITPNMATYDSYEVEALGTSISINTPTGSLYDFQKLLIRIKDNGASARSITWSSAFVSGGVDLPSETTIGKWIHLGFMYNDTISKWMLIASVTEE